MSVFICVMKMNESLTALENFRQISTNFPKLSENFQKFQQVSKKPLESSQKFNRIYPPFPPFPGGTALE